MNQCDLIRGDKDGPAPTEAARKHLKLERVQGLRCQPGTRNSFFARSM